MVTGDGAVGDPSLLTGAIATFPASDVDPSDSEAESLHVQVGGRLAAVHTVTCRCLLWRKAAQGPVLRFV